MKVEDPHTEYPLALLQLALSYSGTVYRLAPSKGGVLRQRRALVDLAHGSGVDVLWSMTSERREEVVLPIRIPIYKGMMGWRIPLIRRGCQSLLSSVDSLRQLKNIRAGQGYDWPDTPILMAHGLNVQKGYYDGLFKMLAQGRVDYFPRSVVEIWFEVNSHADKHLAVDDHLLIHYPTAFYFFVNKGRSALAEEIRLGLEAAITDGRFDELFHRYHREYIERSRLTQRRRLELSNPLLPAATPLQREELWFSPGSRVLEPHTAI